MKGQKNKKRLRRRGNAVVVDGEALNKVRIAVGWTQEELGGKAGVDPNLISKAERKSGRHNRDLVRAIEEALKRKCAETGVRYRSIRRTNTVTLGEPDHAAAPPSFPEAGSNAQSGQVVLPSTAAAVTTSAHADGLEELLRTYLNNLHSALSTFGSTAFRKDHRKHYRHRTLTPLEGAEASQPAGADERLNFCTEDEERGPSPHGHDISDVHLLRELMSALPGQIMYVVGEAGAGKSTSLEHWAWHLADEYDQSHLFRRIPFVVQLYRWPNQDDPRLGVIARCGPIPTSNTLLMHALQKDLALLLFDGLDELHPQPRRQSFVDWLERQVLGGPLANVPILVTSRPDAADSVTHGKVAWRRTVLRELSWPEIERLVRQHLEANRGAAARLLTHVRNTPALRPLAGNPLALTFMCETAANTKVPLPASEGDLLERVVLNFLKRRGILEEEAVLGLLGRLALKYLLNRPQGRWVAGIPHIDVERCVSRFLADPWLATALRSIPLYDICQRLFNSGLLVSCGPKAIRFTTDTYAEFLAGRALAHADRKEVVTFFARHAWNHVWHRTITFMVSALWRYDPVLGADLVRWLLAEVDGGHDDLWRTLTLLAAMLVGTAGQSRDLADDLGKRVLDEMFDAWEHDIIVCAGEYHKATARRSFGSLVNVCGDEVVRRLCSMVPTGNQEDVDEMAEERGREVALVLGCIGHPQAYNSLCSFLGTGGVLRSEAAMAIGQLGMTQGADVILDHWLDWLKQEQLHVRYYTEGERRVLMAVAEAWRNLGVHLPADMLMPYIHDPSDQVRAATATVLGLLRVRRAAPDLLAALFQEKARMVQFRMLQALGMIGSKVVIEPLLELAMGKRVLQLPSVWIEDEARRALWHMGAIGVIDALTVALSDPNVHFREMAARTLGGFDLPQVVTAVENALETESSDLVRKALVHNLGRYASLTSVDALLEIACRRDYPKPLRAYALWGLGRIVQKHPSCAFRVNSRLTCFTPHFVTLPESDPTICLEAARVLTKGRSEKGHEILFRMLRIGPDVRDSSGMDGTKCASATEAENFLGAIVVERRQDFWTPFAIRFLGADGDEDIIAAVAARLDHKSEVVRCCAVEALGQTRSADAVEALTRASKDDSFEVRWAAAKALGKINDEAVIPPLRSLLSDTATAVSAAAAASLARSSFPVATRILVQAGWFGTAADRCYQLGLTVFKDGRVRSLSEMVLHSPLHNRGCRLG